MKVLFFASLKERLDCSELQVELSDASSTVEQLMQQLKMRGENWEEAFTSSKLLVAVNQEMSSLDRELAENDEVAFFPPVTGG